MIKMIKSGDIDWDRNNLISINTQFRGSKELESMKAIIGDKSDNCLFLLFDDADYNRCKNNEKAKSMIKFFTEDDARKIIKFLEKTFENKKDLLVHCTVGISRSSAVSVFSNSYVNKTLSQNEDDFEFNEKYGFERIPSPNLWVLEVLRKISNKV